SSRVTVAYSLTCSLALRRPAPATRTQTITLFLPTSIPAHRGCSTSITRLPSIPTGRRRAHRGEAREDLEIWHSCSSATLHNPATTLHHHARLRAHGSRVQRRAAPTSTPQASRQNPVTESPGPPRRTRPLFTSPHEAPKAPVCSTERGTEQDSNPQSRVL